MSVTIPEGVPSDGMIRVQWVPTFADPENPTKLEVDAGKDLTCFIVGDGFSPGGSDQTVEDRRLCQRQVFEDYGSTSYTIEELVYIYDSQDTTGTGDNLAYETLAPGTVGYLWVRWGVPAEDASAVGQVADVYKVKMGTQFKQPPETNSKLKVRQKPFVNGKSYMDTVLA